MSPVIPGLAEGGNPEPTREAAVRTLGCLSVGSGFLAPLGPGMTRVFEFMDRS